MNRRPLEGIRVLDLGHAAVGPLAGAMLAELGAEVIKIEPPAGEIVHQTAPRHQGMTTVYMALNISKEKIILDLKQPRDMELFLQLVDTADVYTENWRPQAAERLGIDYDSLHQRNPRLVYCNSSGFGATGPLRDMGSYNHYGEAMAGGADLNGRCDTPQLARNVSAIDMSTSMRMVEGILLALFARERDGVGRKVETSQMEAAVSLIETRALEVQVAGERWVDLPHNLVSGCYEGADGWLAVSVRSADEWRAFFTVAGQPDVGVTWEIGDEGFSTIWKGGIETAVRNALRSLPREDLVSRFEAAGVPAGPLLDNDAIVAGHSEAMVTLHTRFGRLNCATSAEIYDGIALQGRVLDLNGPLPGEHNDAVLGPLLRAGEEARMWRRPGEAVHR